MTDGTVVSAEWPEPAIRGSRRSVLASDLILDGDITSAGPIDIHGTVSGHVRAPDLLLASTGKIDGSAIAHDMTVQGRISGSVLVRNLLLSAMAVVDADITYERIAIESGAHLEGALLRRR